LESKALALDSNRFGDVKLKKLEHRVKLVVLKPVQHEVKKMPKPYSIDLLSSSAGHSA